MINSQCKRCYDSRRRIPNRCNSQDKRGHTSAHRHPVDIVASRHTREQDGHTPWKPCSSRTPGRCSSCTTLRLRGLGGRARHAITPHEHRQAVTGAHEVGIGAFKLWPSLGIHYVYVSFSIKANLRIFPQVDVWKQVHKAILLGTAKFVRIVVAVLPFITPLA